MPASGYSASLAPMKRPLRERREAGQAAAGQQVMDERGDEDGLAGAAEAGDAEAQGWREAAGSGIGEVAERNADLVGNGGRRLRHGALGSRMR